MRTRNLALLAVGVFIALLVFTVLQLNGLSARAEPSAVERMLAGAVRRLAIPRSARSMPNPVAFSDEVWASSRAHFADHCASCHANDGSGKTEIGENLYPPAPDMRLADTQQLTDGQIYWIIKNGVRLTGMPAWGAAGDEDHETWELVHFIRRLKDLTPEHIKEMEALNPRNPVEILEELEDQRFLSGEPIEPTQTNVPQHH